jgi:CRP-like cAMP-binding protein
MFDQIIKKIKEDEVYWGQFSSSFVEKEIAAKTVLLQEGEIASHIYYVQKGCLRLWFNKDGKDITLQFFFDRQAVASFDSFMSCKPSMFTLESIEPCTVIPISKEKFDRIFQQYPELKEKFNEFILQRFQNYATLFLSRIKDSPQERYEELLKDHPEIIKRVPQHYIASYLGITPISLSRIRNRK